MTDQEIVEHLAKLVEKAPDSAFSRKPRGVYDRTADGIVVTIGKYSYNGAGYRWGTVITVETFATHKPMSTVLVTVNDRPYALHNGVHAETLCGEIITKYAGVEARTQKKLRDEFVAELQRLTSVETANSQRSW